MVYVITKNFVEKKINYRNYFSLKILYIFTRRYTHETLNESAANKMQIVSEIH